MTKEQTISEGRPVRTGKQNVIILTSGITGSSVLAGFLARSGYWVGDRTHKKEYDTFENQELVDLNRKLFELAGYTGNYVNESSLELLDRIEALHGKIDETPFRDFLQKCDRNRPWVWKDPRLWLTFRYWQHLVNLEDCRFLVLTRNLTQAWLSITLRRQVMDYGAFRRQEEHVFNRAIEVLKGRDLSHLHLTYDELIANPDATIGKMNAFLDSGLMLEDLKSVYHKPLHQRPRASAIDSAKAVLIYLKNYSSRIS